MTVAANKNTMIYMRIIEIVRFILLICAVFFILSQAIIIFLVAPWVADATDFIDFGARYCGLTSAAL